MPRKQELSMKRVPRLILALCALPAALSLLGCQSDDVPQAHRGQMFDRTGGLALWTGGDGFEGPVLGPGTYFTGLYDEVRTVECATMTERESLTSLTKDGVQFGVDIYVRYSANCIDTVVEQILKSIPADEPKESPRFVSAKKLYVTFVRPALGEAIRESFSPHIANDVNEKREQILTDIRRRFLELMKPKEGALALIEIHDLNLSNMDYPDELDHANSARAVQAVLKDKAIAERDRVTAETETAEMRKLLAQKEGAAEAAKIDEIGAALRRNPQYLTFDLQQKMPEIYKAAGDKGNMVIAAPSPQLILSTPAK
jgi:regulator of protease activity HflC (stomatin/prohibitin superfamily)